MPVPKFRPRLVAALPPCLLLCALAACTTQPSWLGKTQWVSVSEVRQLTACNSEGPQARLTLLATVDAVEVWQQAHHVDLIGVDPLPPAGAYVLAELGTRDRAGYGLAISRQAALNGGFLALGATLFTPDPAAADVPAADGAAGATPDAAPAPPANSPCVLVALPEGSFRTIELRDPAGKPLARADTPAQ